jgi:type IV pilus assembly protein PilP
MGAGTDKAALASTGPSQASGNAPMDPGRPARAGAQGSPAVDPAPAGPVQARDDQPPDGAASQTVSTYDPASHRDPFKGPILKQTALDGGPRTPLERYEIGQLRLVGVIWDAGAARAMVEDSAGLGYIVTTGTTIGSSGGVVRRVEPRRLLIEETLTNLYGDKEPHEVVMELPEEDRSP